MNALFKGASYLFKGFGLIHKKGIRRFAYVPMAINTLLFSIAIWLGYTQFDQWIGNMIPTWLPDWVLDAIMWILLPLFTSLLLVIVFFSFSIIANILAEAVEIKLLGKTPPALSFKEILKDAPKLIWNEIRKLMYVLMWLVPLFIFSWIPVINIIAPILWVAFSSWMLAIDYHDYPMGNHQLKFPQQRALLQQKRTLALGFGLATLGATMIPFVNFLVIPAAVAGATALYLENLKQIEPN